MYTGVSEITNVLERDNRSRPRLRTVLSKDYESGWQYAVLGSSFGDDIWPKINSLVPIGDAHRFGDKLISATAIEGAAGNSPNVLVRIADIWDAKGVTDTGCTSYLLSIGSSHEDHQVWAISLDGNSDYVYMYYVCGLSGPDDLGQIGTTNLINWGGSERLFTLTGSTYTQSIAGIGDTVVYFLKDGNARLVRIHNTGSTWTGATEFALEEKSDVGVQYKSIDAVGVSGKNYIMVNSRYAARSDNTQSTRLMGYVDDWYNVSLARDDFTGYEYDDYVGQYSGRSLASAFNQNINCPYLNYESNTFIVTYSKTRSHSAPFEKSGSYLFFTESVGIQKSEDFISWSEKQYNIRTATPDTRAEANMRLGMKFFGGASNDAQYLMNPVAMRVYRKPYINTGATLASDIDSISIDNNVGLRLQLSNMGVAE